MSVTRLQIRQELARLLAGTNRVTGITTSAGAASGLTVIDAQYLSSLLQSGTFIGAIMYMNDGPFAGDWRRVASYDPATGTFTVDRLWQVSYTGSGVTTDATAKTLTDTRRNWGTNSLVGKVITCNTRTLTVTSNTATVATGTAGWSADPGDGYSYAIPAFAVPVDTSFEILLMLNFVQMNEVIDRALRKMLYPTLAVPSLMADADMEASGTDSWTAGTGATLAKDTTAANIWRGVQSLSVTCDATANRYAAQTFLVHGGDTYYVFTIARNSAAATSCKLQAYDATNSAEIDHRDHGEMAWGGLGFSFTVPSTCEQMDIRLITETASGVSYWDHVGLYQSGGRRYSLPSWVTEPWQVGRLVYQLSGAELQADASLVDVSPAIRWEHMRVKKEGATVYVVPSPPFRNEGPIYIEALRPYAALSADASTTNADLDWVVTKARYEALRLLADPQMPKEEREEFRKALEEAKMEAAAMDARFMPKVDYPWAPFGEDLWAPQEI